MFHAALENISFIRRRLKHYERRKPFSYKLHLHAFVNRTAKCFTVFLHIIKKKNNGDFVCRYLRMVSHYTLLRTDTPSLIYILENVSICRKALLYIGECIVWRIVQFYARYRRMHGRQKACFIRRKISPDLYEGECIFGCESDFHVGEYILGCSLDLYIGECIVFGIVPFFCCCFF